MTQPTTTDTTADRDMRLMRMALDEARKAARADEVPVGAVIAAPDGTVIGRGHNLTEALDDVTAHAEMQAITAAAARMGSKYLAGCTLYVTLEPCLMCAGAIGWAQISRIVYAASDPRRGYSAATAGRSPFHPRATVTAGIMADEAAAILREFFSRKR